MMKSILVDYNSIDADDLVRARSDKASAPMFVGDMVLTYDGMGNSSLATVTRIGANGTVHLIVDPAERDELVPV